MWLRFVNTNTQIYMYKDLGNIFLGPLLNIHSNNQHTHSYNQHLNSFDSQNQSIQKLISHSSHHLLIKDHNKDA